MALRNRVDDLVDRLAYWLSCGRSGKWLGEGYREAAKSRRICAFPALFITESRVRQVTIYEIDKPTVGLDCVRKTDSDNASEILNVADQSPYEATKCGEDQLRVAGSGFALAIQLQRLPASGL